MKTRYLSLNVKCLKTSSTHCIMKRHSTKMLKTLMCYTIDGCDAQGASLCVSESNALFLKCVSGSQITSISFVVWCLCSPFKKAAFLWLFVSIYLSAYFLASPFLFSPLWMKADCQMNELIAGWLGYTHQLWIMHNAELSGIGQESNGCLWW